MIDSDVSSTRLKWVLVGVLIVSMGVLIGIGIVPALSEGDRAMRDLKGFYAAGECLLQGDNPYDAETFAGKYRELTGREPAGRFNYPPVLGPFCMALAGVPFAWARVLIIFLNIVGTMAISFVALRMCMAGGHFATRSIAVTAGVICASFVLIFPGTARLIEVGQVSLFAGGLALLAWWLGAREREVDRTRQVLAGIALGMATIKPQFAIIPFTWLFLEERWRSLATAMAVAAILAAPMALIVGPLEVVRDWLGLVGGAGAIGGFYVVMGLPSLLASFELPVPNVWMLILASVPLTIVVWLARNRLVESDLLGILFGAQFALLYGKYVELGLLAPMLGGLLLYGSWSAGRWVMILLGTASLFAPPFLFLQLKMPSINHFKTLVVLYGLFLLVNWSIGQAALMRHAVHTGQ